MCADLTAGMQCPLPISEYPTITLAHGGGGRLTQMLVERMFLPAFANPALDALHDGAVLALPTATSSGIAPEAPDPIPRTQLQISSRQWRRPGWGTHSSSPSAIPQTQRKPSRLLRAPG